VNRNRIPREFKNTAYLALIRALANLGALILSSCAYALPIAALNELRTSSEPRPETSSRLPNSTRRHQIS